MFLPVFVMKPEHLGHKIGAYFGWDDIDFDKNPEFSELYHLTCYDEACIRDNFKDVKIGIFYKFKEEYNALKSILGDNLTDNLEEFNTTDKCIALQIVSGREGISLKEAKYLVYYNIDFSSVSYWQSRDRLTEKTRLSNEIFWIFSKGGIEYKIYKTVLQKKDYTLNLFKQDAGIKNTNQNKKEVGRKGIFSRQAN
jgi:hypothetical protein